MEQFPYVNPNLADIVRMVNQRGVVHESPFPIFFFGEFWEHPNVGLQLGGFDHSSPKLFAPGAFRFVNQQPRLQMRIPGIQRTHVRVLPHVLPIRGDRRACGVATLPVFESQVSSGQHYAGGQALYVPFPRPV